MAASTTRPSGVPGLIIAGDATYGYSIYWESPDKTRVLPVESTTYTRTPNRFRLVRDAKAAAERLRPFMAWDTELTPVIKAMPWEDRQRHRDRIREALMQDRDRADLHWAGLAR